MNFQSISNSTVDRALRLVRAPADAVLSRIGGERSAALGLRVDRADAAARGAAGTFLRNGALTEDSGRRRDAIAERERAARLRHVSTEHRESARENEADADAKAEERRQRARQSAARRRKQAEKQAEQSKAKAAAKADERKRAAADAAAEAKREIEKREKRERLDDLKDKEKALEEKDVALTAAAETRRLEKAAGKAKAKRKGDG